MEVIYFFGPVIGMLSAYLAYRKSGTLLLPIIYLSLCYCWLYWFPVSWFGESFQPRWFLENPWIQDPSRITPYLIPPVPKAAFFRVFGLLGLFILIRPSIRENSWRVFLVPVLLSVIFLEWRFLEKLLWFGLGLSVIPLGKAQMKTMTRAYWGVLTASFLVGFMQFFQLAITGGYTFGSESFETAFLIPRATGVFSGAVVLGFWASIFPLFLPRDLSQKHFWMKMFGAVTVGYGCLLFSQSRVGLLMAIWSLFWIVYGSMKRRLSLKPLTVALLYVFCLMSLLSPLRNVSDFKRFLGYSVPENYSEVKHLGVQRLSLAQEFRFLRLPSYLYSYITGEQEAFQLRDVSLRARNDEKSRFLNDMKKVTWVNILFGGWPGDRATDHAYFQLIQTVGIVGTLAFILFWFLIIPKPWALGKILWFSICLALGNISNAWLLGPVIFFFVFFYWGMENFDRRLNQETK